MGRVMKQVAQVHTAPQHYIAKAASHVVPKKHTKAREIVKQAVEVGLVRATHL